MGVGGGIALATAAFTTAAAAAVPSLGFDSSRETGEEKDKDGGELHDDGGGAIRRRSDFVWTGEGNDRADQKVAAKFDSFLYPTKLILK